MPTKAELRARYLSLRHQLSQEQVQQRSAAIADAFLRLPELANGQTVHVFLPITAQQEVNTWLLLQRLWAEFPMICTVAPRCDPATGGMSSHVLTADSELALNCWSIPEPTAAASVPERELDWILVPLLCFDRRGHRVGYGKGFYDRFLARCRADARKIGVSLLPPVDCISDVGEFDVALDYCLESGTLWRFERK